MKKAALYVRVSTQEQKNNGLSVDNQIEALTQYCKDNGLEYEIYSDAGISAHVTYKKRPQLLRLIKDCQAGNVDVILFTRIDRFFRSIKDYYLVMDQINVPWKAIWEDYETETSSGQFKVNIMLSISEAEAARTSERVRSIVEYKRAKGEHIGCAPLGFKNENGKLVIDPETEDVTRLMFSTFLSTRSTMRTIEAMSAADTNSALVTLRRRLKNELYIGTYITQEEHEIILDALAVKSRTPIKSNHAYLFSGLLKCGICGNRLPGGTQTYKLKDGTTRRQWTYRCFGWSTENFHENISTSERKIEKLLLKQLDEIIGETNIERVNMSSNIKVKDVSKLKAKLERVGIRYEEGDISVETYRKKRQQILNEIREAEAQNRPLQPVVLPGNWKEIYSELTPENKKSFWQTIIKEIVITNETKKDLSGSVFFR